MLLALGCSQALRLRSITAEDAAAVTRVFAFLVGIVGAVSALFAFISLKRLRSREARVAVSVARQRAEQTNEKRKDEIKEKVEAAIDPLSDLGEAQEDREALAKLLDE